MTLPYCPQSNLPHTVLSISKVELITVIRKTQISREYKELIIIIGGAPCSGKSTLTRNIISELGAPEYVEPKKLFPCEKRGNALIVGKYPEGETFGGTDKMSYGAIPKFRDFIDQEVSKHKNIILEGDRFFRSKDIEWLIENHDAKVFVLTVSGEEENRRHVERQDTQTEKWLKGRRTQIRNIMTNPMIMEDLEIRSNESDADSQNIKNEIITIMQGTKDKNSSSNVIKLVFHNDNKNPDAVISNDNDDFDTIRYFDKIAS